jgi:hypothetical protein
MKMIAGLIEIGSGEILFGGEPIRHDLVAHKRRTGYVPEEPYELAAAIGHARREPLLPGPSCNVTYSARLHRRLSVSEPLARLPTRAPACDWVDDGLHPKAETAKQTGNPAVSDVKPTKFASNYRFSVQPAESQLHGRQPRPTV